MNSSSPIWSRVPLPPCPRFPGGTLRADVAVVGAGLTGLSAAYHLLTRDPGRRVLVLEAGRLGVGASGRTTGMLSPGVGPSLGALVRRFGPDGARALYQASLRAVEDARRLIEAKGIDCELRMSGQVVVARGPAGRARLSSLADLHERLGLPAERLDDEALARVIHLAPDGARRADDGPAALRLSTAGTLHPVRLIAGLAKRVMARGSVILEGARVLALGRGRPTTLSVEGGTVIADDVVVATAGYTPSLGVLRGRTLPVHLRVVVTEPLDAATRRRIGWGGREGVIDSRRIFNYFRLTQDNRIVFGGGRPRYLWGGRTADGAGTAAALDELAGEMRRTFPVGSSLRVAGGWTGVIDYTLDGLPVIERLPGRPAALHVGGWCGHGVALSLAAGRWVTDLLADGRPPDDLPWFRPQPPYVPFEGLRWLAFRCAVGAMLWLDKSS